jgi:probable HAF family extracellular repeat protein
LGGSFLEARALNEAGQFTGYSSLAGDLQYHAFLADSSLITDLGIVGSGTFSAGLAINASGQVTGQASINEFFETHAFVSEGGSLVDLGTLGGTFSTATAINDAGQVVGDSLLAGDMDFEAFLYSNGMMTGLGTLGGSSSFAADINQAGTVAGSSYTEFDMETHAFVYAGGEMEDLDTLGGSYSAAFALNDAGVVVGESSNENGDLRGFAYEAGVMHNLGTLGGTYSSAWAINEIGQIIGESSTDGDAEFHGFIYSGGTMIDLGTLGGNYSYPSAINNLGQVVGDSATANDVTHAFLWQDGSMVDLNTLLPDGSGWELITAHLINDAGKIIGFGSLDGVFQVFVMTVGGSANQSPVATALANVITDCQTPVTLDGSASSDPDGDALTFEWSSGATVLGTEPTLTATFGLGVHTVTLTVTDPCGESSQSTAQVSVVDSQAPVITSAPASLSVAAGADCAAAVPNVVSSVVATDNCTAANELTVTQSPVAGTVLNSGQHEITITVTDESGNQSSTAVALNIVDITAPVIASVTASPNVLTPPNNQLQAVFVTVNAADNCDPAPVSQIESITANVPVAPDDIQITGNLTANLAAKKNSSGTERVYTITIRSTDATGNSSTSDVTVTVPKNAGNGNGNGNAGVAKGKNK